MKKKIDIEIIDKKQIPQSEPERQYYFMDIAKNYVEQLSAKKGSPLTFHVTTFGCQMNARDSEKLVGILERIGYVETDTEDADFVIYNTCTVRENANNKVYGRLGVLQNYKKKNPHMLIGLCGCMMQETVVVEKLKESYRFVDLIFGTHNIYKFAELIVTAMESDSMTIDIWKDTDQIVEDLPVERKYSFKSGVNIMFGCNNFCSYCIVPYVRGRERSREPKEIIREIEQLVADGVVEVMLLGQNVNSYGKNLKEPVTFAQLLEEVEKIEGLERIRFMTSHPKDLSEELIDAMRRERATILFVSPLKSDSIREQPDMVARLAEAGIKIYVTPAAQEWDGRSDLMHTQLRKVEIEDLLPREKIEIDMEAVGRLLRGQRILITGAAGSIGGEMVRQIASFAPDRLILVDQAETPLHDIRLMMARDWRDINAYTLVADIANKSRMEEIFSEHRPAYVFHAAAYKHVPMMEDNPCESVGNNVDGTRVIADLAVKYGTRKFVMISTDKAVNPTNVMGCSKRICEIYVQSLDKAIKEGHVEGVTQFVTTRFGNVLGSNGSVIPLFREQIAKGGPVTVTHPDIIRFFMLIPEACRLVLEAGTMGNGGEIFVFDMGKPVRIIDLAKRMIQLSGAKNVEVRFTGLRAGEKLYEEVLNDEEITLPTFHPKIKIAKVREYDYDTVCQDIDELVGLGRSRDDMAIVGKMKAIVPEFKSRHSKYEALDK